MIGYLFTHEGKQYHPGGTADVADVEKHNAELERAELAHWQTQPDRFVAYIVKQSEPNIGERSCCTVCGQDVEWAGTEWRDRGSGTHCLAYLKDGEIVPENRDRAHSPDWRPHKYLPTLWRGAMLGKIIARSHYRNNLTGSRMEYVRVRGNNGATYYGSYGCDWSQVVHLRKVKGRS